MCGAVKKKESKRKNRYWSIQLRKKAMFKRRDELKKNKKLIKKKFEMFRLEKCDCYKLELQQCNRSNNVIRKQCNSKCVGFGKFFVSWLLCIDDASQVRRRSFDQSDRLNELQKLLTSMHSNDSMKIDNMIIIIKIEKVNYSFRFFLFW